MRLSSTPEHLCVTETLRKASRSIARLYDERLANCDMTSTQFSVLRAIGEADGGGQALSRLADQMRMERTTLYRALKPMEKNGWVACSTVMTGRTKMVTLTAGGRDALDHAALLWEQAQSLVLDAFGVRRWVRLHKDLKDLAEVRSRMRV